jgi:hypothetical protein
MTIDVFSFVLGMILMLACVIIVERVWGRFWSNKKIRELQRQVRRLETTVKKKDEMIKKSLKALEKEAKNDT